MTKNNRQQSTTHRLRRQRWGSRFAVVYCFFFSLGCDPEGRKDCQWYLVPDTSRIGQTAPDLIPVCARNFETNKQDCRLQTSLAYAKKVEKMRFRYIDLKVKNSGTPRTISEITFCKQ